MTGKRANPILRLVPLAGLLVLLCSVAVAAEEKGKNKKDDVERFSAVAVGTGGSVGGRSVPISITIREYTSDEEVERLATVLREKGQEALRRELEKLDVGQIAPQGRLGNEISVARMRETEHGRMIFIATARVMSFPELYVSGRSRDYPFGFVSLQLNDEGKGIGNVIVAAKLKFDKEDELIIESYGNQYVQLSNVRQYKKKKK